MTYNNIGLSNLNDVIENVISGLDTIYFTGLLSPVACDKLKQLRLRYAFELVKI